jgi:hypothetical protein
MMRRVYKQYPCIPEIGSDRGKHTESKFSFNLRSVIGLMELDSIIPVTTFCKRTSEFFQG